MTDHLPQHQTHEHDLSVQTQTSSDEQRETVNILTVMSLSNLSDTDNFSSTSRSEFEGSDLECCPVRTDKLDGNVQLDLSRVSNCA